MIFFIFFQCLLGIHLIFPLILKILKVNSVWLRENDVTQSADYAIIVTYYKQLTLLPGFLRSINELNYENFMVYIVADGCEDLNIMISNPKVVLLRPPTTLSDNIESHRFAIRNFVRPHDRITIIDGDNLVDPNYLLELNFLFDEGYIAVQGSRFAKNLNTEYANLDGVSDLYFRYVDRKLLYEAGSSATLSGSGMAFTTKLYSECIENYKGKGAGFDKVLQCEIVKRKIRIAFNNNAIVWDQKTTNSKQLVSQRSRWINTWFNSVNPSLSLCFKSLLNFNRNGFLFSLALLRPPLFILAFLGIGCIFFNIIFFPVLNLIWLILFIAFFYIFSTALKCFAAPSSMYLSLYKIPKFLFYQIMAFMNLLKGNPLSVATEHNIQDVDINSASLKSKIRILHTIRQGQIGGGETHVIDLVENLNKDKFESYVLSFSSGPMVDKLKGINIEVFVIPTTTPFDLTTWNRVSNIVKDRKIDVIHAHGTRAFSNTFYSSRLNRIPIIYTVHGWSFHPDQNPLVKWIRIACEGFLIKKAYQTIFVSKTNFNEGIKYYGKFNAKVIRNGINQLKFNPDKIFSNFREEFNISKDVFLVGFIARITKQKNPMILLDVISKLPDEFNVKFVIVGDGDLKNEMVRRAQRLGVMEKIIFIDSRRDVENILNAIDVYCLPSLWEGLSIGLLEAMAMKKAVIVSDISGNTEVVDHLNNGLVIQPIATDLAQKIKELYNDRELGKRLAENAFLTINDEFKIENMVEVVAETYCSFVPNYCHLKEN